MAFSGSILVCFLSLLVSWQSTSIEGPDKFWTTWVLKRCQDKSPFILSHSCILKELWVWRRRERGWCHGCDWGWGIRSGVKGTFVPVSATVRLPLLSVWAGLCVVVWLACSLFCFQTCVSLEWRPSALTFCCPHSCSECMLQNKTMCRPLA